MTADQLIAEGRKLQRPCFFLRPEGSGEVAAIWHERDDDEIDETGFRCWLTINSRFVPGLPSSITGYISLFSNEQDFTSGKVEISAAQPKRGGTKLYAHAASVIPPFDAVVAKGSGAVGDWLKANNWPREKIVEAYLDVWRSEFPLYFNSDIYAILGGWHWPSQDDDWHDLIDEQLIALTIHDSEPWVET
jgi:hypothetical protein